jgi:LEA14-like dessication related protein
MKLRVTVIFPVLITLLVSCGSYKNITVPTIESISGFKAGNIKDGKVNLSFTTHLNNPGLLKFRIRKTRLNLIIGNVKIGEVENKRSIKVRRSLKPEIQWEVTADLNNVLKNPGILLQSLMKGKLDLQIQGDITVSKFLFRKTIPVNLKTPFQMPAF